MQDKIIFVAINEVYWLKIEIFMQFYKMKNSFFADRLERREFMHLEKVGCD